MIYALVVFMNLYIVVRQRCFVLLHRLLMRSKYFVSSFGIDNGVQHFGFTANISQNVPLLASIYPLLLYERNFTELLTSVIL